MTMRDLFLRACKQQVTSRAPVWFMRQAGRYDPQYRKIKERYSLLEICAQPELAAEITMQPVRTLGVDAAILYSDIMNPMASLGVSFDIVPNVGPVIENPIHTWEAVQALRPIDVEGDLGHILATIRLLRQQLQVPLITFAGAPFTLASYLIEGRPSKRFLRTKAMMYAQPTVWFALMDKLGDAVIAYLQAHVAHGAQAVQLFDSWVGALSPHDFVTYVYPTVKRIFKALESLPVPKIYFPGVASGELLSTLGDLSVDVIGIDWRVPISLAHQRLPQHIAIQGNLDPLLLTAPDDVLLAQAKRIIDEGMQQKGYIFNLGHGLFPEASVAKVQRLTSFVQEYSAQHPRLL